MSDDTDGTFTIVSEIETVSTPSTPSGPSFGYTDVSYTYSSSGGASSLGHSVQYFFDWGDGNDSGWLDVGTTSASHSWSSTGAFSVRAKVRCATHTTLESSWSPTMTVVIGVPGAYFNSPANRLIVTDAFWAPAQGSGTWISDVQITDVSGGSTVQVYYNCTGNRRGPFTLWTNSGGANRSVSFGNILQTIDGLDAGAFTYFGTSGVLEFITQDAGHLIQAAARTFNGDYSRTFPALADVATNTAALGRSLLIPNISNDTFYRSSMLLFNPGVESVTVDVKIIGNNGAQIGSTIPRTLAGYEMIGIATELRTNTYNSATIMITVTSGSGRVMVAGYTANNVSNDPASHIAVQAGSGYANSPASRLVLTDAFWAPAQGSGTWISEVQITDVSGSSTVQVYYNCTGNRRGPFTLWTNSGGANSSISFSNILQTIDGLDSGAFTYFGTSGVLEFVTQNGSHLIQAAARTFNGDYSRTFPALADIETNTAALGRSLLIPNISNDTFYRSSMLLFNPGVDSVTVDVKIIGNNGVQIGSTIPRTLAGYEMLGIATELRTNTYSGATIMITATAGSGRVMVAGYTANNVSNDPATHIAVQAQ